MAYEGYDIYLQYQETSPKNYLRTVLQQRINRDFEDTMNVYTIKEKNRLTGVFTDITVRIERYGQEFSFFAHDDYKKIIFKDIDYNVFLGDIFEFEGYRWIVIQSKTRADATASCVVQKCNGILKFTESTPLTENIIELDCLIQSRVYDVKDATYIQLPKGKLEIIVPFDSDSSKIRVSSRPTRFLLGQQDYRGKLKSYVVENIDSIGQVEIDNYASTPSTYAGSLRILMLEDVKDTRDNHEYGVAYQRYFI